MIRFSCPGCAATYSVDDAKAGKTGKCPKCQSQFLIPAAEAPPPLPSGGAPPPLPTPPAADPGAAVEIAPCPGCQARLSVAASDLGVNVECPYCKTVYAAVRPGAGAATASRPARAPVSKPAGDEFAFAGDDRPRSKRRRDDEDDEPRPSRRRRDEDDEDDYDRPKKKRRKSRYDDVESKRITAGILALL